MQLGLAPWPLLQDFGRPAEGEDIERNELGGVGKQRAGDAGIDRGNRVDRNDPRRGRHTDRTRPKAVVPDRSKRQCLFCSSTSVTREHLWPKWLIRRFVKPYIQSRSLPFSI